MAKSRPLTVQFPSGGVHKRFGYNKQAPFTTPSALNIWPTQWDTGRERGGVRPGLTVMAGEIDIGTAVEPYGWCDATWVNAGVQTGVAVVHTEGVSVREDDASAWTSRISTNPGTTIASCAVYHQKLLMARSGDTILFNDLTLGAGAGAVISPSAGTVPTKCPIIVSWGDRVCTGGDTDNPQIIYMSAVGDHTDWDYSDTAASAAWANTTTATAQQGVGEPITALIPHNTDCLLVGGENSLYAIRGNPNLSSNPVYSLSSVIGPLSQNAWCKTGNDYTLFLSRDGLYGVRPGCGEPPVSLSRERIPEELLALDPATHRISLAYDVRFRGVMISVTTAGDVQTHYWYDLQTESFWPVSFGAADPYVLNVPFNKISSTTKGGMMMIDDQGFCWQFDTGSAEAIDSHLYYGPIAIGSPHGEGVISEATAVLSEDSGDVKWSVYAADSPQQAYALGTASFVGSNWDVQGLNYRQNPVVRGSAAYIKVEDVTNSAYSIEEIALVVRQAGRSRVG